MDIDKHNFYPLILDILTHISTAHFVAFDLELSGVPSKDNGGASSSGKATLQQRYAETKEAAERYQILQIGLTCVEQDVLHDKYVLRPYNFDLCPIINERLDVERVFSVQAGAAEFLLRNGFDMNRPFRDGVPYLTRAEAQRARATHARRQDKAAVADIPLKPTEVESIAFLQRVRDEIDAWLHSRRRGGGRDSPPEYLNINSVAADAARAMFDRDEVPAELSRFEKRLVHQLVRAEYPDQLVTVSKRGFIQILRFDAAREARIAAERRRELDERIGRQKGFRWLVAALHGGDVSGLDFREIARSVSTGEPIPASYDDYKAQLHAAQARLRGRPRVLVGHNCFLDLVYIYHTFVGALPDTVEGFARELHALWPVIIDTKYLSTHECGDINPVSSLEQIADQLSAETIPTVQTHRHHGKYRDSEAFHEAGFDSYLTAQIAVRLSSKLRREGRYSDDDDVEAVGAKLQNMSVAGGGGSEQNEEDAAGTAPSQPGDFVPSVMGAEWKSNGDPTLGPRPADDPFHPSRRRAPSPSRTLANGQGMPRFGTEFWRVYGNKLRVFGTQESLCVLTPPGAIDPVELNPVDADPVEVKPVEVSQVDSGNLEEDVADTELEIEGGGGVAV